MNTSRLTLGRKSYLGLLGILLISVAFADLPRHELFVLIIFLFLIGFVTELVLPMFLTERRLDAISEQILTHLPTSNGTPQMARSRNARETGAAGLSESDTNVLEWSRTMSPLMTDAALGDLYNPDTSRDRSNDNAKLMTYEEEGA